MYEIVLKTQKAMIERCSIGVDFNKELKEEAALLLLEGLIQVPLALPLPLSPTLNPLS